MNAEVEVCSKEEKQAARSALADIWEATMILGDSDEEIKDFLIAIGVIRKVDHGLAT